MTVRRTWLLTAFVFGAVVLAAVVFNGTALSGELEPPAAPGPTMHSLDEIYTKLSTAGGADGRGVPPVEVAGPGPVHMWVESTTLGAIEGSCEVQGREGSIVVAGLAHELAVPYDSATGTVTGQRQHSPLRVLKGIDKSTPLLYQTLISNTTLNEVLIRFYRYDPAAEHEVEYYTIQLDDARIISIKPSFPNWEEVEFVYGHIQWDWVPDGIQAEDDVAHPEVKP